MFKSIFSRKTSSKENQAVIVVSGLPRSGTSMMMKMLADGGLEIVSDTLRTADDDNPNGYFEFEPVKLLGNGDTRWLSDAGGKVVKIISSLLEHLPREYQYKIVFMDRDLKEVLASQQKMLKNRQEQSQVEDAEMRSQFERHLSAIKFWLARQPNMDVIYVNYNDMLANPQTDCARIAEFIGMSLNTEKMLLVPTKDLYRNRAGNN